MFHAGVCILLLYGSLCNSRPLTCRFFLLDGISSHLIALYCRHAQLDDLLNFVSFHFISGFITSLESGDFLKLADHYQCT